MLGALVLAHSLLDNGTTKKLAVLVTEDAVSREAIAQLEVCSPLLPHLMTELSLWSCSGC